VNGRPLAPLYHPAFHTLFCLFKERVGNLNHYDTIEEAKYITILIENKGKQSKIIPAKMGTTLSQIEASFYQYMIDRFAEQPLKKINPVSFQAFVSSLCHHFPDRNEIDHEAKLRCAIVAKHRSREFGAMVDRLTRGPDPETLAPIIEELRVRHTAIRNAHRAEINRYRKAFEDACLARSPEASTRLEEIKAFVRRVELYHHELPLSRLKRLNANLSEESLKKLATQQAYDISLFYTALEESISDGNKQDRHLDIHIIMNRI
jgi:hypothetical protein